MQNRRRTTYASIIQDCKSKVFSLGATAVLFSLKAITDELKTHVELNTLDLTELNPKRKFPLEDIPEVLTDVSISLAEVGMIIYGSILLTRMYERRNGFFSNTRGIELLNNSLYALILGNLFAASFEVNPSLSVAISASIIAALPAAFGIGLSIFDRDQAAPRQGLHIV